MISFALQVNVDCQPLSLSEGNEHHVDVDEISCVTEIIRACGEGKSSGSIFVASASYVCLSLDQQVSLEEASTIETLAVLIPAYLTDSINCYQKTATHAHCQSTHWITESVDEITSSLLSNIHPFLCEGGKILGILSVGRGKPESAPADVLLLNVSNAPQRWLEDILAALNGESMALLPDRVLRILPLSKLTFLPHTESSSSLASPNNSAEIPACPVCLHRVDPLRFGLNRPQNYQMCSKFCSSSSETCRNQQFLRPWSSPNHCAACRVIEKRWNALRATDDDGQEHFSSSGKLRKQRDEEANDVFCNECAMQETLWVCLTCGFVGCGRYSHRHAAEHYQTSGHPYSLELATLRIWDYTNGEFAHRGDLLECPSIQRAAAHAHPRDVKSVERGELRMSTASDGGCSPLIPMANPYPVSLDEASPKKATMVGEEYEALLQSALEDQAQHYEGEITRLRAALTAENVDKNKMTTEEAQEVQGIKADIARYRVEIDRLGRQLLDAQGQEAGYRADSQRLLREQSVAKDLLDRIREEAAREHGEGTQQVDELEQQVNDLTANLRMRREFSQDQELSNAQIFGTTGASSSKKSNKKGKKSRRLFRR